MNNKGDSFGCENCFEIVFDNPSIPKREKILLSSLRPNEKEDWITVINQYFEINPSAKLTSPSPLSIPIQKISKRSVTNSFIQTSVTPREGDVIKISLPTFTPRIEDKK